MKQGVMPCLAPRDLTTYLGFAGQKGRGWERRKFNVEQGKCGLVSILEKSGFVTHLRNLSVFECLVAISMHSSHEEIVKLYRFVNPRTALTMPPLNIALELLTSVPNSIIVVLIMYWPGETIPKHPLRNRCQSGRWIIGQKPRCRG